MVQHSWINEIMRMFGVVQNMEKMLDESMKYWITELKRGKQKLGKEEHQTWYSSR